MVRSRLTYANVVATLALFVALGGGAYAVSNLPKHSVGAKQLKGIVVRSAEEQLADGGNSAPRATCQKGERAFGGGGRTGGTGGDIAQEAGYPVKRSGAVAQDGEKFAGWQAFFHNEPGGIASTFSIAYALCLKP